MALQGVVDLDDFYRLLFVPGMQHCSNNVYDARWYFGGGGQASTLEANGEHQYPVSGYSDSSHNVLLALMSWAEQDEEVSSIIGTKFTNDTVSQGALRQRPICKYPTYAVWDGSGDVDDEASSWECVGQD